MLPGKCNARAQREPLAKIVWYYRRHLAISAKRSDVSVLLVFRVLVGKRFNVAEIHFEPL
jgi:hypothetical protein